MANEAPLGVAFIGLRHQHPRWYQPLWPHLPQYKPIAICERDQAFLNSENSFFHLDAFTDYRHVLDRRDIDVVVIWLPHSEMPDAVEAAAAAGKHVIVEKPCCADLKGAQKILETSKRFPHVKISSPYCWRTHPASRHIREFLTQGLPGEPQAFEARLNAGRAWRYVRDHAPWMLYAAEGGGPMWNLGVHWIDYLRWLTGQRIVSVVGQVTGPIGEPSRDIEDNAQALLRFERGAIAVLDISYGLTDIHPGNRDIYLSIRGSKGALQWSPAWEALADELLLVSESDTANLQPVRRVKVQRRDISGYGGEMALNWLAEFADAITEGRQPMIDAQNIYDNIAVVDAFYKSISSGKVELINFGPHARLYE